MLGDFALNCFPGASRMFARKGPVILWGLEFWTPNAGGEPAFRIGTLGVGSGAVGARPERSSFRSAKVLRGLQLQG